MATGIFGANTDELRAVAGEFARTGLDVGEIGARSTLAVDACLWLGPDALAFKAMFTATIAPKFAALVLDLEAQAAHLGLQATDQDLCSDGLAGLLKPFIDPLMRMGERLKHLVEGVINTAKAVGGSLADWVKPVFNLMDLLRSGHKIVKAGINVWKHLVDGLKSGSGMGAVLENAGKDFLKLVAGDSYAAKIGSMLGKGATWLPKAAEALGEGSALGTLLTEGGSLAKWAGSHALMPIATAFDGAGSVNHFLHGEYKDGFWDLAKTGLDAAIIFSPPPFDVGAAVAVGGMSLWEHREGIASKIHQAVNAFK